MKSQETSTLATLKENFTYKPEVPSLVDLCEGIEVLSNQTEVIKVNSKDFTFFIPGSPTDQNVFFRFDIYTLKKFKEEAKLSAVRIKSLPFDNPIYKEAMKMTNTLLLGDGDLFVLSPQAYTHLGKLAGLKTNQALRRGDIFSTLTLSRSLTLINKNIQLLVRKDSSGIKKVFMAHGSRFSYTKQTFLIPIIDYFIEKGYEIKDYQISNSLTEILLEDKSRSTKEIKQGVVIKDSNISTCSFSVTNVAYTKDDYIIFDNICTRDHEKELDAEQIIKEIKSANIENHNYERLRKRKALNLSDVICKMEPVLSKRVRNNILSLCDQQADDNTNMFESMRILSDSIYTCCTDMSENTKTAIRKLAGYLIKQSA